MRKIGHNLNWFWSGLPGAILSAGAGMYLVVFPGGEWLRNKSYDEAFRFRSEVPITNVVMVYADVESAGRLSEGIWERWDRSRHAELLERLKRWGADLVAFDYAFAGLSANQASDDRLVRALAEHGRAVLAAYMEPEYVGGRFIGLKPVKPLPRFSRVAAGVGYAEMPDQDLAIRTHNNRLPRDERTLAWRAAELTMPTLPANPWKERWINYYGPPGWIDWHHFADVLLTTNDMTAVFSNKVVFVGANFDAGFVGGRGTDNYITPYTALTKTKQRAAGAEVNATAYLNLIRGDWLERLPPLLEFSLLGLLGAGFGFGLIPFRPLTAVLVGMACALLLTVASLCMVWLVHCWLPWMIVAVVQIPCAAGWSVLSHFRRLLEEKHRAEKEKKGLQQRLAFLEKGIVPGGRFEGLGAAPAAHRSQPADDPGTPTSSYPNDQPRISDHELLSRIGQGAYGEVWLARDLVGSYRAVKIIYRRSFEDSSPFDREFRGIQNYAPISFSHPGLVPILHVGRNERQEYFYYIMQLGDDQRSGPVVDPRSYSARTLSNDLKRLKRLPLPECLRIGIQLCEALEFLHQRNLIHRDIKPSNIIFVQGQPKLADIGLVAPAGDVSYVGTKDYMGPDGPGTPAADVYSLGLVMYVAAFGLSPRQFSNLPTSLLESGKDPSLFRLNDIILKACDPVAARRYASAAHLRADLMRLMESLNDRPAPPPQPSGLPANL
jgi:CHASE2 domain-containing sensor protein